MAELDLAIPTSREGDREAVDDEPDNKRLCTREVIGMWNLVKIYKELATREQCIAFAEAQGLVLANKECRHHRKPMSIDYSSNNNVGAFICRRGVCKMKPRISRAKGTWFENIRIDLPHVFYLMYCFAHHWSYKQAIFEDCFRKDHCFSHTTITDWYDYCRETVAAYKLDKQEHMGKIGGPGKIVQINESKFERRKSIKGTSEEGKWVIGMMENGSEELRLEVSPDNSLSAEVLLPIIQKHVNEHSIIHTGNRQVYDCLSDNGFMHVIKDTTQSEKSKSQWGVVKKFFYTKNDTSLSKLSDIILEYVWRSEINRYKKDPFLEIIEAVKYVFNKK